MKVTDNKLIKDDEFVTVYSCGNYKEFICCRQNTQCINITKLSKNQYVDNNTDDIREYHYSKNKSLDNFKKQFKNIPRLIRGYFNGDYTERFITLTYSYEMDNPYNLSYDFKKFIKRIERRYYKCRYIYIKEPNNQGSWHIHSIIKRLDEMPFNITVERLRSLWTHGYEVSVAIPYNIDTLPYYFDITRFDNKKPRIIYYPSYMQIYGCSKGMKVKQNRGLYKDLKPSNMKKVYETENQYLSVNKADGEILGSWITAYEQYKTL